MIKCLSWNVNGLRACMGKGFADIFQNENADIFCLQETKLQAGQLELELPGYHQYWNYADKKGYSGVAVFCRQPPADVRYGLGMDAHDHEGRAITLEFPAFYLVNVYVPNAQDGLARIAYRLQWEADFRAYLTALDQKKPVVVCGDLNVAHREIDLKNPGPNRGKAGFSDEERAAFSALLDAGFIDSFRLLHPEETGAYSWWSYRFHARENNAGWRIDYFLVSQRLSAQVREAKIRPEIYGSDHCPVELLLDMA